MSPTEQLSKLYETYAKSNQDLLIINELTNYNMLYHGTKPLYTFYDNPTGSNVSISFFEFGRACHRVAHAIRPDQTGNNGETVAILANMDNVVYHAITMGIMLAGWTPFPISPRNSAPGVAILLQKTNCHRVLVSSSTIPEGLASDIQRELSAHGFAIDIQETPSISAIYPSLGKEVEADQFKAYYPICKQRDLDEVAIYLHSSGSTGFPKPIPHTFRAMGALIRMEQITDRLQSTMPPGVRVGIFGMPPYHLFGFMMEVLSNMVTTLGTCLFPPMAVLGKPPMAPTSENIIEHAKKTKVSVIMSVASFPNAWATEGSVETMEFLKSLDFVSFGGGPLAFEKGRYLVDQGVKLHTSYGATEIGLPTLLGVPEDPYWLTRDWNYVQFSDKAHVRMVPQDDGRTYECQLLTCETHYVAIENIPDAKGYATSDLFERHPTRPNLWRVVGRKDDVIILSTGEKTVPGPMEDAIGASRLVNAAVMFGRERNQVGVLIEPKTYPEDPKAFIDEIWPYIEAANADAPAFSRIVKHMVLLTKPDKKLLRADKGTVKKKASVAAYAEEIQALYESLGIGYLETDLPSEWSAECLQAWLLKQASALSSKKEISTDANLFEQGFDSISATILRNQILGAIGSARKDTNISNQLPANLVYSHPTISELVQFTLQFASPDSATSPEFFIAHRASAIQNYITKFSAGFLGEEQNSLLVLPAVTLLTGSTGSLGSFLLNSLLRDDRVSKVYAYNRPGSKSAKERQIAAFIDRDLDSALLESPKLTFVEGVLHQENLGLSLGLYDELRSSVTSIIHNAWQLDFNLSLSSFETHVVGTRRLVDFALDSPFANSLRFMFTSSIGTAQSWLKEMGPYPEEMQKDARYAIGGGYGESKYVCEHILANSGLQATSFRIGQITGPAPSGAWSTTDWVPIMVKSSLTLGSLPNSAGKISWLPATVVSDCITDVMFGQDRPPLTLNVVHPKPVAWIKVFADMHQALSNTGSIGETEMSIIPFSEWFSKLEAASRQTDASTLKNIPAIKIISFFRSFVEGERDADAESAGVSFSTDRMQRLSETFARLPQIGETDVIAWVKYWKSKGLFT